MMAAGLTGVYAEQIPNVEVLTLVVFFSGVLLGARDGALVGALSEFIYSLLNPYGAVHPLVMIAQVTGLAVAGAAGGVSARLGLPALPRWARAAWLGLTAAGITAWFDLVTNLATGLVFGQIRLTLLGGIPFALIHIGSNVLLFALLGTPLCVVFWRYRERLSY